jgi:anti-sigma B factor antagonist
LVARRAEAVGPAATGRRSFFGERAWQTGGAWPGDGATVRGCCSPAATGAPTAVVVRFGGALDIAASQHVRERFADVPRDDGVVVDLTDVTFIDSAGLGALIGALRRVREAGGTVAIVATHRSVRRLFAMTGVDRIARVAHSMSEAAAGIARPAAQDARPPQAVLLGPGFRGSVP